VANTASEDFTEPNHEIKNQGKLLYIARGAGVEKNGAYVDGGSMENTLKHPQGHIAFL